MNGPEVVEAWMSLLSEFDCCFTTAGSRRFRALLTGSVLCERRPLVTEIVTALGLQEQWRSVEAFVEYGAWWCCWVSARASNTRLGAPVCCAKRVYRTPPHVRRT